MQMEYVLVAVRGSCASTRPLVALSVRDGPSFSYGCPPRRARCGHSAVPSGI